MTTTDELSTARAEIEALRKELAEARTLHEEFRYDVGVLEDKLDGANSRAERAEATKEAYITWIEHYKKLYRDVEAEVRTLREARWWMPWDSAPHDGRWLIAMCHDGVSLMRVSWGRDRGGELAWCTADQSFGEGMFAGWINWPAKVFGARAALNPSPID